jgi:hypothetical protein
MHVGERPRRVADVAAREILGGPEKAYSQHGHDRQPESSARDGIVLPVSDGRNIGKLNPIALFVCHA